MTDSGTDIGAPMHARREHDPLCPTPTYGYRCPRCDFIANVRADERHKVETEGTDITRWHQGLVLAYLRTKVEALTHDGLTSAQSAVVLKRDVLALIDGSSDV